MLQVTAKLRRNAVRTEQQHGAIAVAAVIDWSLPSMEPADRSVRVHFSLRVCDTLIA
jgi:hypothetical protein